MTAVVRILVSHYNRVTVYSPSPDELDRFVPAGRLIAQLWELTGGYCVYHAVNDRHDFHHDHGHAVLATLHLTASDAVE
jgi:hypothetical protein